jgi:acetyl esterase
MPVDPQIQLILDKGAGVPATHTLAVEEARRLYEARIPLMAPPPAVDTVYDRLLAGPGGQLRVRIYRPVRERNLPMMVFFHGSGFVLCSLNTHNGICQNLCAGAGCTVVSVDYRLAPEHKFPAGLDDCVWATRWAVEHAQELDSDPNNVVIAGDSAGGNMAAAVALRLRDEGGPTLRGQLLIYPVTDYHTPGTPSYERNAEGYGLTRETMKWFWRHYLNDEREASNPYASPLRARDLSGLPRAMVATAEYDPLCDEGEMYAARLAEAGLPVQYTCWPGMNHGFFFWVGIVDQAGVAMAETCEWLREVFRQTA